MLSTDLSKHWHIHAGQASYTQTLPLKKLFKRHATLKYFNRRVLAPPPRPLVKMPTADGAKSRSQEPHLPANDHQRSSHFSRGQRAMLVNSFKTLHLWKFPSWQLVRQWAAHTLKAEAVDQAVTLERAAATYPP